MPPLISHDPVIQQAAQGGESERLYALAMACRDDPARFISSVLGDDGSLRKDHERRKGAHKYHSKLWWKQHQICRSVINYRKTLVPAGNSVGKSFLMGRLLLWFLYTHPNGIVFSTAPSQHQLDTVLWKEVRRAHAGSRTPLGGKVTPHPLKIELAPGWVAYGHATNKVERITGHHTEDLLALIDEGSGISDPTFEAVESLNPSRTVVIGNPLYPHGRFFELCEMARNGTEGLNLVRISSLQSPHAHLARSPYGMADKTWLDSIRAEYGEQSLYWLAHVLAQFPGDTSETAFPSDWLDLALITIYVPSGKPRLAIDLGKGNGGDRSVVMARDDGGITDLVHNREWSDEDTAAEASKICADRGITGRNVSYDGGGLGAFFGNTLAKHGIKGAREYLGQAKADNADNLRSAAARQFRRRLQPNRVVPKCQGSQNLVPQKPFAIRKEFMDLLRPELAAHRVVNDLVDRFALESATKLRIALKHSPDFADTLLQLFAF